MQNVTLSDPPADALAAIKARLRPRRRAWGAAAAPLVAGVLAYGAAVRGSRPALLALGGLGIATLLIALVGDLPDARATGVIGNSSTRFSSAAASPEVGLFLETVGAIALVIASGCGLLLGSPGSRAASPASES